MGFADYLRYVFWKKKRFSEFKEGRAELSNKALSRSLKFMEGQELIKKVVSDGNIEYFLTDKGKSLNKLIYDLVEYTLDNNGDLYNEETVIKAKEGFKRQLLD